ncbi:M48 family metalloprotease [Exilibacterium tricleocarpae]|uniref:M48 family metalloprotease n=1 Tax=Exilibacterium tricleocarpae TaxID=2591008 RepID=UPI001FE4953A|nr:M48 family metalloprotease [Exilibacterium tricleocarpae]
MPHPARHRLSACLAAAALCATLLAPTAAPASGIALPELGDAASGIVSPAQEYQLGQSWLRAFRSQVPTFSDAQVHEYLEQTLYRLVGHSQLRDRRLELIVVKNPTMNAFAVPGGVVGVHTGLLLYAESEHQLASVLAHELAHLSQRHFARGVEQRQNASTPTLAALLASLVLAATAGGDAGLAALTATQAAALDARLRFSRQNEQEADRIGMQTMVEAGMNPHAVPEMFERMLRATRYTRRPPEFLLTHPVTESRIADSRNRAQKYPKKQFPESLDFHLMRARIQVLHEKTPGESVKRFLSEIEGESLSPEAARYGLVLAATATGQLDRALFTLAPMLEKRPGKIPYLIAHADLEAAGDNYPAALKILEDALQVHPNSHALTVRYAELLMQSGNYPLCEEVLADYSRRRPKDDYVWYLLAEVHGLAGNILGVHRARAEYFILNGVYDKALQQLNNALKLSRGNFHLTALLRERLRDVRDMRAQAEL